MDKKIRVSLNCTEVRFASFFSGGFTTLAVLENWKNAPLCIVVFVLKSLKCKGEKNVNLNVWEGKLKF